MSSNHSFRSNIPVNQYNHCNPDQNIWNSFILSQSPHKYNYNQTDNNAFPNITSHTCHRISLLYLGYPAFKSHNNKNAGYNNSNYQACDIESIAMEKINNIAVKKFKIFIRKRCNRKSIEYNI